MKREDTSNNTRLYCDHVSYLGFPTYSFEPSQSTNPTQVVYMTGGDPSLKDSHTLMIDLSWILAAWSVDNNGTIGKDRQISQGMTNTLPAVLQSTSSDDSATESFTAFHYHTLLHALSMVKWSIYEPNPAETECPLDPLTAEGNHCLQKWVSRRVWAYSIGSRTSKLGATVVIIGIIVAVARLCLGVFHPNREHSLLGLFIAALRHTPQGERERGTGRRRLLEGTGTELWMMRSRGQGLYRRKTKVNGVSWKKTGSDIKGGMERDVELRGWLKTLGGIAWHA